METPFTNPAPTKEEELTAEVKALREKFETLHRAYLVLLEQNQKLERGILFQGRERVLDEGTTLALLGMLTGQTGQPSATPAPPPPPPPAPKARPKPTGRKPLPAELPRVDIDIVPPDVTRLGRDAFELIGEDVTETVERRAASLVVVRIHRLKFVPRVPVSAELPPVLQAPPPELPIPKALPGPAFAGQHFGESLGRPSSAAPAGKDLRS